MGAVRRKEKDEVLFRGGKVRNWFSEYLYSRIIRKQRIQEVFKLYLHLHFQFLHTIQTAAILSVKIKVKVLYNKSECGEAPY